MLQVGSSTSAPTRRTIRSATIAEAVAEQIPVRLSYVERAEDPRDYRVSFERIAALGFTPRMRLRDGIREVADAIASGLITDPYAARYRNS